MPRIRKFNKQRFSGNVNTRKVGDKTLPLQASNVVESATVEEVRPGPRSMNVSSSSRKLIYLKRMGSKSDYIKDEMTTGNIIVDLSMVQDQHLAAVKCKICSSIDSLQLCETPAKRRGIVCSLQLSCKVCDFQTSFMTSPKTNTGYFDHNLT